MAFESFLSGREFLVRPDTQDTMAYQEVFLDNEYRLPDTFAPDDVIVDVGAHIGSFAFACLARGAKTVRCYEPADDNFVLLAANMKEFPGVTCHNLAVWESGPSAERVLALLRRGPGFTAMPRTVAEARPDHPSVEAVGLDAVLSDIPECRMLKLDCEGAEYPILLTSTLLRRCREIVGELHDLGVKPGWTIAAVKERLVSLGFDVSIEPVPRTAGICYHFWAKRRPLPSLTPGVSAMKFSVAFARFPFKRVEDPDGVDWLIETIMKAKSDPRFHTVHRIPPIDTTPITKGRNYACKLAIKHNVDFLVMLDSDNAPDKYLRSRAGAQPFWDSSIDFLLSRLDKPSVIAAPYCGPPPQELVYVFQFTNQQSDHPNIDLAIEMIPREQAAIRGGIEQVAALPTGVMIIDVRVLKRIWDETHKPWFEYEYADAEQTELATTEDVFATRNWNLAGVDQFVNWDAWAGHWKLKCVGPPALLNIDNVREGYRDAILRGQKSDERLVMFGEEHGSQDRLREAFEQQKAASANGAVPAVLGNTL